MCKDLLKIIDESPKIETNGTIIEKIKKYSNIFDILTCSFFTNEIVPRKYMFTCKPN